MSRRLRARPAARRRGSRPGSGGRAAGDRVRRLRVPVLRGRQRAPGSDGRLRRVFRHFPVRSSHPRAWAAACAAEAAGLQGRFWEMHDSLFADQGRLEDPHLWERARGLGLDLERFDADRRGDAGPSAGAARLRVRDPRRGRDDADPVRRRAARMPVWSTPEVLDALESAGRAERRRQRDRPADAANSGRVRAKTEPVGVRATVHRPPCPLAIASTIASPRPDPAGRPRAGRVGAGEPVEDPLERLRRHPAALVLDLDQHRPSSDCPRPQLDRVMLARELDRVLDQRVERGAQALGIDGQAPGGQRAEPPGPRGRPPTNA